MWENLGSVKSKVVKSFITGLPGRNFIELGFGVSWSRIDENLKGRVKILFLVIDFI
jgi:hypothetical protein